MSMSRDWTSSNQSVRDTPQDVTATALLLGGAINKHPLLVLRALRQCLRRWVDMFGFIPLNPTLIFLLKHVYQTPMMHALAPDPAAAKTGPSIDLVALAAELQALPPFVSVEHYRLGEADHPPQEKAP